MKRPACMKVINGKRNETRFGQYGRVGWGCQRRWSGKADKRNQRSLVGGFAMFSQQDSCMQGRKEEGIVRRLIILL